MPIDQRLRRPALLGIWTVAIAAIAALGAAVVYWLGIWSADDEEDEDSKKAKP